MRSTNREVGRIEERGPVFFPGQSAEEAAVPKHAVDEVHAVDREEAWRESPGAARTVREEIPAYTGTKEG